MGYDWYDGIIWNHWYQMMPMPDNAYRWKSQLAFRSHSIPILWWRTVTRSRWSRCRTTRRDHSIHSRRSTASTRWQQLVSLESSNRQHFAELISALFTDWTLVPFFDSEFQQLTPSLFGWSAKPWKPSNINIAISGLISQLWAVATPSIPCPCPSRPVMRRSWHVMAVCSGTTVRHRSH